MVEVSELKKSLGGKVVLDSISFTIEDNDTVCLIGSTGSGKSSLLRCIAGLEEPDSGSITINGEPRKLLAKGGKHRIGMVLQSYNLFPHLDVLGNVMLAPEHVLGLSKKDAEQLAMSKLEQVGLAEKASCRIDDVALTVNKVTETDGEWDAETGAWTRQPTYSAWLQDRFDCFLQGGDGRRLTVGLSSGGGDAVRREYAVGDGQAGADLDATQRTGAGCRQGVTATASAAGEVLHFRAIEEG